MASIMQVQSSAKKDFALGTQKLGSFYLTEIDLPIFKDRIIIKLEDDVKYIEDEIGQGIPPTHRTIIVPIYKGQKPFKQTIYGTIVQLKVKGNPKIFFNNSEIDNICQLCEKYRGGIVCPDYSDNNLSCLDARSNGVRIPWMDLDTWGNIVYHE